MKDSWKKIFIFSRGERNAIFFLIFLLFIILASKVYVTYGIAANQQIDTSTLYRERIAAMPAVKEQSQRHSREHTLFSFNPNEVDAHQLQALGLSEKAATAFIKYRQIIGKFDYTEQIQKIYVVSPELYNEWLPYILLPSKSDFFASKNSPEVTIEPKTIATPKEHLNLVEIQTADSATLEKLPGIGAYVAGKIVKFRNALGGFASLDQLNEVKGMRPENIDMFKNRIVLSLPVFKKLKVNTADWLTFNKHPYIDGNLAKALVNYRKAHGNYQSVSDLSKIVLMGAETLKKLEPYLEF